MATVTAFDASRSTDIENAVIVSAAVEGTDLVLTRQDDGEIRAEDFLAGVPTEAQNEAQFVSRVRYVSGAYQTRPAGVAAGMCEYVGPTEPTSWLTGDTWVETA